MALLALGNVPSRDKPCLILGLSRPRLPPFGSTQRPYRMIAASIQGFQTGRIQSLTQAQDRQRLSLTEEFPLLLRHAGRAGCCSTALLFALLSGAGHHPTRP